MPGRRRDAEELLRLGRQQALSLADRVGAREVEAMMREAVRELEERLRGAVRTGATTSTSIRDMETTLAQLREVITGLQSKLGGVLVQTSGKAAELGASSMLGYIKDASEEFAPRRALPIREASMFSRAVAGAEASVLGRVASTAEPQVRYSRSPRSAAYDETLVKIPAKRLDALWSRDEGGYLGPGDAGIGKRREGVASFVRKEGKLYASQVTFDPVEGRLIVVDGRHRLAVLRDSGADDLVVSVRPDELETFIKATGGVAAGQEISAAVPVSLAGEDFVPTPNGVLTRYGVETIRAFEDVLRNGMLTGKPWGDVRDELTAKSPFLQGAPRSWAERIVRTETMGAYNRASWESIRAADDELGDMVKILSATFDSRTGWDSIQVHGQIRRPDEAFMWKGGLYQSPPNRPNDREVVVPHRISWPLPDDLAWRSDGEVAAAWRRERRKGGPPSRPLMTTVPLKSFGRSEKKAEIQVES